MPIHDVLHKQRVWRAPPAKGQAEVNSYTYNCLVHTYCTEKAVKPKFVSIASV